MPSRHIGIELPPFLGEPYDQAWDLVAWAAGRQTTAGRLFSLGWHGLGNRALTTVELFEHYRTLPRYGSAGHDGNHHSDQTLTNFLFNSCSSVDCLAFGLYGIGHHLDPSAFPATDAAELRRVERKSVGRLLTKHWPTEELAVRFAELNASASVDWLYTYRDVFTHRGTPPRHHFMGGANDGKTMIPENPKALPPDWVAQAEVDSAAIIPHYTALSGLIERVVDGALTLAPLHP
jgi:hypothetical protein